MADNKIFVLNSINQSRHFDFEVSNLANKVLNVCMRNWALIVRDSLLVEVKELIGNELTDEKFGELRKQWLDRLFQHGKVNVILEKFKKMLDSKVLAIPSNFILYDDQENAQLGRDEATDEGRQLEAIRTKRAYILQLRIEIETLKKLQNIQADI